MVMQNHLPNASVKKMMMFYLNDYRMLSVKEQTTSALLISVVKALSGCSAASWGFVFQNNQP